MWYVRVVGGMGEWKVDGQDGNVQERIWLRHLEVLVSPPLAVAYL